MTHPFPELQQAVEKLFQTWCIEGTRHDFKTVLFTELSSLFEELEQQRVEREQELVNTAATLIKERDSLKAANEELAKKRDEFEQLFNGACKSLENNEGEILYDRLSDYVSNKLGTKGEHSVFETVDNVEARLKELTQLRALVSEQGEHIQKYSDWLYKIGICKTCGAEFKHHLDEPFTECPNGCFYGEDTKGAPLIQKLRALCDELANTIEVIGSQNHNLECPNCRVCEAVDKALSNYNAMKGSEG